MAQLDLPELLEQILYFLEFRRSLYPAHLWYHCGAPILWRRVEFFNEDYQQSRRALNMSRVLTWRLINFARVMRGKIKPLYCSKMVYLRLEGLKISDALIGTILRSCPDIRFLILDKSKGFTNIPIIEIARFSPKLQHLSLNSCICLTNRCITEIARSCPKLRHLELGGCSIGDEAVEEIARNCTNLKYLSLGGCKGISEEVMKKLNPKIKIEYPLPLLLPIFTAITPPPLRLMTITPPRPIIPPQHRPIQGLTKGHPIHVIIEETGMVSKTLPCSDLRDNSTYGILQDDEYYKERGDFWTPLSEESIERRIRNDDWDDMNPGEAEEMLDQMYN
ncbi:45940_t:CDS:2 [Gigaspora margarita]|uniref:45940_t:CDS:1 n=1 Tax=Gigaspora margarita TaxID=4874 RepID=A0ABN7VKM3_GIGMA|nr:45940_t:CDS:2 [Gigaspora margarita]